MATFESLRQTVPVENAVRVSHNDETPDSAPISEEASMAGWLIRLVTEPFIAESDPIRPLTVCVTPDCPPHH